MKNENCITCIVGITLLFSSIYMTLVKDETIFQRFVVLLDEEQRNTYFLIVKERLTIYILGMILGLTLGLMYFFNYPKHEYRICTFLAIVYLVKLGFYYFSPKSPLMLYSLKTKAQVNAWADIYSDMKYKWQLSILIGFIGYILLSLSLK
jgi:hypothetical protein